jgi:hypothetical protein
MWIVILALPLILVSCSGGGTESAPVQAVPPVVEPKPIVAPPPPPPPPSAALLWKRNNAIMRSQTDGSGQVTLTDEPAAIDIVLVSGTNVVYRTPQIPAGINLNDIWAVQTDGTDRHLVLHDPTHEHNLMDVIGSWVLYTESPTTFPKSSELASVRLDGTGRQVIAPVIEQAGPHQANYYDGVGGRLIFEQNNDLFSLLPDGTDRRLLVTIPRGPNGESTFSGTRGAVGSQVLYSVLNLSSSFQSPDLFAVPVTGGPVVTLAAGPENEIVGAIVDPRVVYNRCGLVRVSDPAGGFNIVIDHCDVYSVQNDGSNTTALTVTPDINYVQGAIGERVIIRRSQRGGSTDSLFSLPVNGGVEPPLLTLSAQNEFVSGFVVDRVIVRRTTGLWSLKADGSGLVQLTSDASDRFSGSTGPFACFARGLSGQPDLWCVPRDGNAPATLVTASGTFVTGL